MSVTYTNRKGVTYFLGRGATKTGKTRYFFAREPGGELVEKIPEGYEISESVNGIVSLAKAQPALLRETEILAVKNTLAKHPRAKLYRVEVKARRITIYEYAGTDPQEVFQGLSERFGLPGLVDSRLAQFEAETLTRGPFMPVLRFTLVDDLKRWFKAERMCYLGSIDNWIDLAFNKPIEKSSPAP